MGGELNRAGGLLPEALQCDVYLAVVGFRYGSRVPGEPDGVSYAELEFNTATVAGLPRLVFLLDEEIPVPRSLVDRDGSAVDGFRERLRQAEVATGRVIHTLAGHTHRVECCAFSPDGTVLAAAGGAGTHLLAYVTGPVQSSEVIGFRCPVEPGQ